MPNDLGFKINAEINMIVGELTVAVSGGKQLRIGTKPQVARLILDRATYEEAEIEILAALQINDRVADLHLTLGLIYWAQGRLDEAIDEFNRADTFDPDNPYPDTYIARIYLYLGEYGKSAQGAGCR